jgi:hypothetical protein
VVPHNHEPAYGQINGAHCWGRWGWRDIIYAHPDDPHKTLNGAAIRAYVDFYLDLYGQNNVAIVGEQQHSQWLAG